MKSPAKRQRVVSIGSLLVLLSAAVLIGGALAPSYALEPMTVGYYGSDATLAIWAASIATSAVCRCGVRFADPVAV